MEFNLFILPVFLFLFFETEGLLEWLKFFKLSKFLPYYEEFESIINSGGKIKYLLFLSNRDKSFLMQLITCPVCLSVWLSLLISLFLGIRFFPIINFSGLFFFYSLKLLEKFSN
jgi:hypothetical protein